MHIFITDFNLRAARFILNDLSRLDLSRPTEMNSIISNVENQTELLKLIRGKTLCSTFSLKHLPLTVSSTKTLSLTRRVIDRHSSWKLLY